VVQQRRGQLRLGSTVNLKRFLFLCHLRNIAIPVLEVGAIVKGLCQHLDGTHDYALHSPRAALTAGVGTCTYLHWFKPFSQHRRNCKQLVSVGRMQLFLQFRLGSHQLPVSVGQ